ncbi:MAG: DapH/DapD/GlmU-related protein [Methanoregula sp.]
MRLSDYGTGDCEMIRDGMFSSLGSVFTRFPGQLVSATREDEIKKIQRNPSVTCVITVDRLVMQVPENLGILSAGDPWKLFHEIAGSLSRQKEQTLEPFENQISPSAIIHPSATIACRSVRIGKHVSIGKNVVIHEHTAIEDGAIIRSGSIIGNSKTPLSSGISDNDTMKPLGGVHIQRDVDIHANTIIDRAFFKGCTEIGTQTKIDNLVHIGPGAEIGNRCLVVACAEIGEAVRIGDDSWIGPNVTLADQVLIGKNVYITLGSAVTHDIGDDKVVKDNYALDRKRFKKVMRGM